MLKERRLTSLQEVIQARPEVIQRRRVRPSHRTLSQKSGQLILHVAITPCLTSQIRNRRLLAHGAYNFLDGLCLVYIPRCM
jgi:hypothetical protein